MKREIVTIVTMLVALIAIIVLKGRCGPAVGELFKAIDTQASDGGLDTKRRGVNP
jgi:hypothetical protein